MDILTQFTDKRIDIEFRIHKFQAKKSSIATVQHMLLINWLKRETLYLLAFIKNNP